MPIPSRDASQLLGLAKKENEQLLRRPRGRGRVPLLAETSRRRMAGGREDGWRKIGNRGSRGRYPTRRTRSQRATVGAQCHRGFIFPENSLGRSPRRGGARLSGAARYLSRSRG